MLEDNIVVVLYTILSVLVFIFIKGSGTSAHSEIPIALPNCPDKCGNITIPYPFGIGHNCYYNPPIGSVAYYSFICDNTTNPPTLLFHDTNLQVVDVSLNGKMLMNHYVSYSCFDENKYEEKYILSISLLGRITISSTENSLVAIGCDTYAWFGGTGISNGTRFNSGCMTVCNSAQRGLLVDECSGIGCCLGFIPDSVNNISIEAKSFKNHSNMLDFNPCSVAFMVAKDAMPSSLGDFLGLNASHFKNLQLPVVHYWSIGTKDCATAKSLGEHLCKGNTSCLDLPYQTGYRCLCNPGFQGNPYLYDCQDIDECAQGNNELCHKPSYCVNTIGSYDCVCPQGYVGEGTKNDPCVLDLNNVQRIKYKLLVGLSITLGSILSTLIGWWLYSIMKRRKVVRQRAKYFERNGGLLLQKQVYSDEVVDRIKIFTIEELEKATDHFNENRILGLGGRGTVYKGMLGEGKIVAIKKSNKLEENQLDEFINELVILSQINHRNIVKLLGCCLETKIPLLVYEFIPNGTLFDNIHNLCQEFPITWKMRLQIASDSAGALAYLHSSSSIPIFHRDIKSSNILLDDKYRAKLSDFGTSRFVATDKTHVTTRVMGTFGYLDPEYFRSHQFTEKSDVYSFGVVLVELLTGQKAIRATLEDLEQDRSLTSWFLSYMEKSCILDIVDSQILQEGSEDEFLTIANLAKQCLNLDGRRRPTMKELLVGIESILALHLPQMNDELNKTDQFEQVIGTQTSHGYCISSSSTFYLESLSSAEDQSLLFNTY
ncbi:unnamed protein product [Amaranthus hypochondriacus]